MKTKLLISIVLLFGVSYLYSQETKGKIKFYRTWLESTYPTAVVEGVLYELKDSSIVLSNSANLDDYRYKNYTITEHMIKNISSIKVRKKSNISKGMFFGGLLGFAGGMILGFSLGDDPKDHFIKTGRKRKKAATKAAFYSMVGTGGGMLIGAALGSMKITIPINKNVTKYRENKSRLKKYTIKSTK